MLEEYGFTEPKVEFPSACTLKVRLEEQIGVPMKGLKKIALKSLDKDLVISALNAHEAFTVFRVLYFDEKEEDLVAILKENVNMSKPVKAISSKNELIAMTQMKRAAHTQAPDIPLAEIHK